jgi:S1-C subfamily serine protease
VVLGGVWRVVVSTPLADTDDVQVVLNNSEFVGKTINVQIVRGGTLIEVAIAVGERPSRGN